MTHSLLTALAAFAFVSSKTPEPNNLMLMTSGANYGFRRTVPHMMGVAAGFTVMIVIVGLGLINLPCVSSWVVLEKKIQRGLSSNARLMVFNWAMAPLLVATLFSVL